MAGGKTPLRRSIAKIQRVQLMQHSSFSPMVSCHYSVFVMIIRKRENKVRAARPVNHEASSHREDYHTAGEIDFDTSVILFSGKLCLFICVSSFDSSAWNTP